MKRNLLIAIGISFLIFAVLSWIVPVGTYSNGELSKNGTDPVGLFDLFGTPVSTLLTFVLYSLVFACIGGFYGVMEKTGALGTWVTKISNRFSGKEKRFLVFTILFFVILSSLTGLVLPLFILVPLFAMVLFALNFDKVTAMASTIGALLVGSMGSTYGFNITGYTKNILSLDMNNQIVARIVILVLLTALLIFFVLKFSKREVQEVSEKVSSKKSSAIEKPKKVSPKAKSATTSTKGTAKKATTKKTSTKTGTKKTTTKKTTKNFAIAKDVKKVEVTNSKSIVPMVILLVLMMIVVMVGMYNWYYGFGIELFNDIHTAVLGVKIGDYPIFENLLSGISQFGYWGNSEFIVIMVITSMIIGWIYKLSVNDYVESFIAGVKKMMPTAIYAALASVILSILYQASYNGTGTLVDTIYNGFGMGNDFNVFITSVSALIGSFFYNDLYYLLAGLSSFVTSYDASSISIAGFIIQSVYGVGMIIFPTSVILIAGLSYFDVKFTKWIKYIWKFALAAFILILVCGFILAAL